MIRDRLERIKERAYALWERAGGVHGDHESHWHQASTEIDQEAAVPKRGRKQARQADRAAAGKKPATKRTDVRKTAGKAQAEPKVAAARTSRAQKTTEPPAGKAGGAQSAKAKVAKAATVGAAAPAPKTVRSTKAVSPAASSDGEPPKAKRGRKALTKS